MRSVWFGGGLLSGASIRLSATPLFRRQYIRQFSRVRKRLAPRGQPILLQQVRHNVQRLLGCVGRPRILGHRACDFSPYRQ